MHERNVYKSPPDFAKLAEQYQEFAKFVTISSDGRGHINFKDAEALRELTCTLLQHDFGLTLDIPLDRLIPTVPLRLNYILWIEDLISGVEKDGRNVKGLDIGCGASCIYPLLGVKLNKWKFIASEFDDLSYSYAEKNIATNNFAEDISLRKGSKDILLNDIVNPDETYTFTMCNPPFFSDRQEASGDNSRTDSRPPPHSICTAVENETVTEGGEVAFVKKMIKESLVLKEKISWYTTMLGKKTSLKVLRQFLKEHKVPSVTSTVFQQGKTTRWGLCWSFSKNLQISQRSQSGAGTKTNQMPFTFTVTKTEVTRRQEASKNQQDAAEESTAIHFLSNEIKKLLTDLQIELEASSVFNKSGDFDPVFTGEAWKNTWSHQRQKRRIEKRQRTSNSEVCNTEVNRKDVQSINYETVSDSRVPTILSDSPTAVPCKVEEKGDATDSQKGHSDSEGKKKPNIGKKRAFPFTVQTVESSTDKPLFKFKIVLSMESDTIGIEAETIKVDVICLEGNRESVHQLFMFLRNKLNGLQPQNKRKEK